MTVGPHEFLLLSALLFAVGLAGVIVRRNTLVIYMSLELMLNAANLALVAFARFHATPDRPLLDGYLFTFLVITVAAAEVAVGLAIIVALFRRRQSVQVDDLAVLRH